MKKLLSLALCFAMLLALVPFSALNVNAETYTDSQGVTYTLSDDGMYYEVTCCDESTTEIVIPKEYNGLPIKEIGYAAFKNNDNITSVVISDSVIRIGAEAFIFCDNLICVEMPTSIITIGTSAFYGCNNLRYTEYENGLYLGNESNPFLVLCKLSHKDIITCDINQNTKLIGEDAFLSCDTLESIEIPNTVTSIGSGAFASCENLSYLKMGNSVSIIEDSVFSDCTSLTSIEIPDSVTSIGNFAFSNCTSLKNVDMGNSVESIGAYSFSNCKNLISIELPNSLVSIDLDAFENCVSLMSIDIPDSVISIEQGAFSNCTSLENVNMSNSITTLSFNLFENCSNLSCIDIPASVTSIDTRAFYNCTSLTNIVIPEAITYIKDNPFEGCSLLETITVESGNQYYHSINNCLIETAKNTLIVGCKNSVIPNNVINIGDSAFSNCDALISIEIPDSVLTIGLWAFSNCDNLKEVTLGSSISCIGQEAFFNCPRLTCVEMPSSITSMMGFSVFGNCISLETVKLSDLSEISVCTFENCTNLQNVEIPKSVASIWYGAFSGCENLTHIEIPDSVKKMGMSVFNNCDNLTDIYCEAESQPEGWHTDWLGDCTATVHWGYKSSDDDTSSEPDVSEPEEEVIYDIEEGTNIEIEENDAFEPGTVVTVIESIVEEVKEIIKDVLDTSVTIGGYNGTISDLLFGGNVKNQIFDFTAEKDGEAVQPKNPIIINIPIPDGYSDKVVLKYLSPNGTLEDVEHTVDKENRKVTATIEHFSYYVLIDEGDLEYTLGDINANDKIDMTDYILLKRAYFGTYKFTEEQNKVGDINKNNKIDMTDYILLKRVYFGTYTIK